MQSGPRRKPTDAARFLRALFAYESKVNTFPGT